MASTLSLPDPPVHKREWPWFSSTVNLPSSQDTWPKISIVTPSYNQGRFIEATIRSVLLQGYPNLEYFVIDGGSTDETLQHIDRYAPFLTDWVSEPDRGQSHALNKGFARTTGDILGWINSDDYLLPGALLRAAQAYQNHPDAAAWAGCCHVVDQTGTILREWHPRLGTREQMAHWGHEGYIGQPACFFSANAFRKLDGINERLDYAMDVELWLRLLEYGPILPITGEALACARDYPEIKTWRDIPRREAEIIAAGIYAGAPHGATKKLLSFVQSEIPYPLLLKAFVTRTAIGFRRRIQRLMT